MLLLVALASCTANLAGSGTVPTVQTTRAFSGESLKDRRVAVFPLAMVGESDDQRSGVILQPQTRAQASDASCNDLADSSVAIITCLDAQAVANSPPLLELQSGYALDRRVSPELLRQVHEVTHTDFALLIRPEEAFGAQAVRSNTAKRQGGYQPYDFSPGLPKFWRNDHSVERLSLPGNPRQRTRNTSARGLVVSAVLLDLRRAEILKFGDHATAEQRTVRRNLGHAETPELAPLLEEVMIELGEAMLRDPASYAHPASTQ